MAALVEQPPLLKTFVLHSLPQGLSCTAQRDFCIRQQRVLLGLGQVTHKPRVSLRALRSLVCSVHVVLLAVLSASLG